MPVARETTRADLRSNPGEDREGEEGETVAARQVALAAVTGAMSTDGDVLMKST